MKKELLFCISMLHMGSPALSVPEAVLDLSKKRVREQFLNQTQQELSFDNSGCSIQGEYQIFSDGLQLKFPQHNQSSAILFLNFQELIEGEKISFPKSVSSKRGEDIHIEANIARSYKREFVLGAALLGIVSGVIYFHKRQSLRQSQGTPLANDRTGEGIQTSSGEPPTSTKDSKSAENSKQRVRGFSVISW